MTCLTSQTSERPDFHGYRLSWIAINDTIMGFKICGFTIFLHNSYRKLLFREYWKLWIGPSTKIGTPRKLSHSLAISILT